MKCYQGFIIGEALLAGCIILIVSSIITLGLGSLFEQQRQALMRLKVLAYAASFLEEYRMFHGNIDRLRIKEGITLSICESAITQAGVVGNYPASFIEVRAQWHLGDTSCSLILLGFQDQPLRNSW